jgi:hypothetical protein
MLLKFEVMVLNYVPDSEESKELLGKELDHGFMLSTPWATYQ